MEIARTHIPFFLGQVQVGTTPCASITSVAPTTTLVPVSQYSDGQIQVTPAASVPTVTSAAGTGSAPVASGSSVVVPTETAPSGSSATGAGSTLATSKASTGSSSATSSAAASGTSAPSTAGAADLKMPSVAALMVVLAGAVALF